MPFSYSSTVWHEKSKNFKAIWSDQVMPNVEKEKLQQLTNHLNDEQESDVWLFSMKKREKTWLTFNDYWMFRVLSFIIVESTVDRKKNWTRNHRLFGTCSTQLDSWWLSQYVDKLSSRLDWSDPNAQYFFFSIVQHQIKVFLFPYESLNQRWLVFRREKDEKSQFIYLFFHSKLSLIIEAQK